MSVFQYVNELNKVSYSKALVLDIKEVAVMCGAELVVIREVKGSIHYTLESELGFYIQVVVYFNENGIYEIQAYIN